jgi:hypothetical protein
MDIGNANCKGAIAIKDVEQLTVLPQGQLSFSLLQVFFFVCLVAQQLFWVDFSIFSGFVLQHLREHASAEVAENSDINKVNIPIKMCKRMRNHIYHKNTTKYTVCQVTEMP